MYTNKYGALCYGADESNEDTCPVCGSDKIEETATKENDGDKFDGRGFKCSMCGAGGYKAYIRVLVFNGYAVTEIPPNLKVPKESV